MGIQNLVRIETHNNRVIELMQVGDEYRIDSRFVAPGLGIEHKHFLETIRTYQSRLERWGILPFETAKITEGRGRPETYALLNRNQILFAITLSRNTEEVLDWKEAIIDALDQLEKQVKSLTSPAKQKQLSARKLCPTLEDRILRFMCKMQNQGVTVISVRMIHRNLGSSHDLQVKQIRLAARSLISRNKLIPVKVQDKLGRNREDYQLTNEA